MDADTGHLQRFADAPYVVEAPASRSRAAAAAARALSGVRVRFAERRGIPDERYRAIVESVRAQVEEGLSQNGKWRIEIVDRTARDLAAEGRRIDRSLASTVRGLGGRNASPDAFAQPFPTDRRVATGCAVVGFPPGVDARRMLSEPVMGAPVAMQGVTNETFQRTALWHELGHCLLGASEAKADLFSALMAIRHGVYGTDALATMASYREVVEWTGPADDDHFIAAGLWEVVARADALRADGRFMGMDVEGIAGLANALGERFGLDAKAVSDAMAIRSSLQAAAALPAHTVPGPDGRPRRATVEEWGALRATQLPELRRMDTVVLNLVEGARPLDRFIPDLASFRERVSALAGSGDPTAKAMLASLDRPPPKSAGTHAHDGGDFAQVIPYRFAADDFSRRVIAMTAVARLAPAASAGSAHEDAPTAPAPR